MSAVVHQGDDQTGVYHDMLLRRQVCMGTHVYLTATLFSVRTAVLVAWTLPRYQYVRNYKNSLMFVLITKRYLLFRTKAPPSPQSVTL